MKITEMQKDLFEVEDNHHLAHCISSDYALGAGIAVAFNKKYDMKRKLFLKGTGKYPDCIQIGNVFNLVTKNKCWEKPTYENLRSSLFLMKDAIVSKRITHLAMPRIGSGLDRLEWAKVKEIIEDVFQDIDIEILICYL